MADKKKKDTKKPTAKKPSYEQTEYNKLSSQVNKDIAEEKKDPSKTGQLAGQVNKDIKAENALTEAGMGHPDAKALVAAGIPENRVQQLTQQYAPSHPANGGLGETANPTTPAQNAADILIDAGLPDTASNEKLLEAQMTEEGMPGSENNPLATTLKQQGSTSVNSAGVQEYPSSQEGDVADAETIVQSQPTLYAALKSGTATPQDYATALENSNYEGLGGSSNPANVAYGQSFLSDAGQPETSFPGGGSSGYSAGSNAVAGSQALTDAAASNAFSNLSGNLFGTGTATQTQNSLQSALSGLSSNAQSATEEANTTQAPGSPDQSTSASQKTSTAPPASVQTLLAQLIPGIVAGSAGKNG